MVEAFLQDLDARWKPAATERIVLRVIGSTALMLQAKYVRGTKDSDVFHTNEIDDDLAKRLLALAGAGTDMHKRHRLYIQLVRSGLVFRRQVVEWCTLDELNAGLRSFRIEVMSVLDVVVSKLKRLNANDLTDIQAMIERELVTHEALIACSETQSTSRWTRRRRICRSIGPTFTAWSATCSELSRHGSSCRGGSKTNERLLGAGNVSRGSSRRLERQ